MAILIRVRGRTLRPRVFRFPDSVQRIVFGRDPARCQVLFAPRVKRVGLEHCALERVLGTYRWILNDTDEVYCDGLRVFEGDVLPTHGTIRLGARGPRLFLAHGENAEAPVLRPLTPVRRGARLVRETVRAVRLSRIAIAGSLLLLAFSISSGAFARRETPRSETRDERVLQAEALRSAAASVYRTLLRSEEGIESGGGTAWVVGPGLLATNAHVARHFPKRPSRTQMLVRSSGPHPRTFVVTGVRIHPGYELFPALWEWYQPSTAPAGRGQGGRVHPAGTACDVALLEVDAGPELGAPLRLAAANRLHGLQPGDAIGYVGYPSEQLVFDGSPLRQPNPQIQVGRITALTTCLGQVSAPGVNYLIQHNCAATGGASGSPVLAAGGEVIGIVNAMNISSGWMGRIPSAAGVNFAQRVDYLQELLEGRAEAAASMHLARWTDQLQWVYPGSGAETRRLVRRQLSQAATPRASAAVAGERAALSPPALEAFFDVRASGGQGVVTRDLAIPEAGVYALACWSYGQRTPKIDVHHRRGREQEPALVTHAGPGGVLLVEEVPARAGETLELVVTLDEGAARIHYMLWRTSDARDPGVQAPFPVDVRAHHLQALEDTLQITFRTEVVYSVYLPMDEAPRPWERTLRSIVRLPCERPGFYLVIARTLEPVRVGIETYDFDEPAEGLLPMLRAVPGLASHLFYRATPGAPYVSLERDPSSLDLKGIWVHVEYLEPLPR
jgi:hypothetical protein